MKHATIKSITFLILISLLSFDVSAVGLQEYLQSENIKTVAQNAPAPEILKNLESSTLITESQLTRIIEMVVAGIVASALIISILALFFGRWTGKQEKKRIKILRIDAEKEKDHITCAVTTVREQEKETTKLVQTLRIQASDLTNQKKLIDEESEKIKESSEKIREQEKELSEVSQTVSHRMDKIQSYWNVQLQDTVSTIHKVQSGLDENLNKVDADLETIQHQKVISQELLQVFLNQHNEQRDIINTNSEISEKVSYTLEETLRESNQLIETLKKHQESAEKLLKKFTDELTHYEEQAYEQFDTSFQVADLARQELTANIDESRKHIETMRRHEEQSHTLNSQTHKNLEALDYSKIVKLSNTLDSTQDMFSDIRTKVDDAKSLLDELKDIETDIRETASNVEAVAKQTAGEPENFAIKENGTIEKTETISLNENVYKIASGDNTPVSFFTNLKSKD